MENRSGNIRRYLFRLNVHHRKLMADTILQFLILLRIIVYKLQIVIEKYAAHPAWYSFAI